MSKFGVFMLLKFNKLFKKQVHPFNLQNEDKKSYAEWQYEKGEKTIEFFLKRYSTEEMFKGKKILDIGCGAGGKSLYYAKLGGEVTGVDVVESYELESKQLCEKLGFEYGRQFTFMKIDASHLPFSEASFDTVIMNDAFEHVSKPEEVLTEALRVLKPKGRIYINFPPYYHPFGAHLSDAVNIPWVHLFYSESTMVEAYKRLVAPLSDGEERVKFRISKNDKGKEYFSYINKMTIRRSKKIWKKMNIQAAYYSETPLRKIFKPFCHIPLIKEMFVKMVTIVIEK